MTEEKRVLSFVEIDIDFCSLTYGTAPCRAQIGARATDEAYRHDFISGNDSWSPTNGTLTTGADGSLFAETGSSTYISRTGLTIDGTVYRYVSIDIERTANGSSWLGALRYSTAGHSFGSSYQKLFSDITIDVRQTIVLDMWDLDAGGTDWAENDITGLRLRLDDASGGAFRIRSIRVGASVESFAKKCFNTLKTCQDSVHFDNDPVTLRFAKPAAYLPNDIEAIPSIRDVSLSPGVISLGEDLGIRATLNVSFGDHRWADTGAGFDKYVTERSYNPFDQGTFWGKFRARQPYLRGRPIRLIRGLVGQSLEEMETRHFVIESFDGPTPDGTYSLVAKDPLKLADADRAQAPRLSRGFLVAAIDNDDTAATLSPSGIGNLDYPSSGYVAIGGKEICAFTRSGDALTLTRAQLGTVAQDHDGDDRVQLVLRYVGQDPADIIADLLENYAGIDAGFIPIADWQLETATYLQRVYTATLAEPTAVQDLISELVEQAALAIWWSDTQQKIRLQVLRAIPTDAARFTGATYLEGSLKTREQPAKRISQVWTYYGLRNPLEPIDDPDNYRSSAVTVDLTAEANEGAAAIKKIFSRWISHGGRTVATRLNDIQLGRFVVPPRRIEFDVLRYGEEEVILGGGYRIEGWPFQDDEGAAASVPVQVTSLDSGEATWRAEAEEVLFQQFDPDDLSARAITIDSDVNNVSLRDYHDALYPVATDADVTAGVTLTCIVETGVVVGSDSHLSPAFDVGTWPSGFPITLVINGRIAGAGGPGGNGGSASSGTNGQNGTKGGTALYTRHAIDLEVASGELFGGGGGGGGGGARTLPSLSSSAGGGGGGGAGRIGGAAGLKGSGGFNPSNNGNPGTLDAGGAGGDSSVGGDGGNGGGPGQAGNNGGSSNTSAGNGGAAGNAIDGDSYVTVTVGPGDIRGAQVN